MNGKMRGANIWDQQNIAMVKTALCDLRNALAELYQRDIPKILVYGSQARGEANQTSDIDVLLLYPNEVDPGSEIRRISPILADLNVRYQVLVSILPTSEITYQRERNPFWETVRREGVSIDRIEPFAS